MVLQIDHTPTAGALRISPYSAAGQFKMACIERGPAGMPLKLNQPHDRIQLPSISQLIGDLPLRPVDSRPKNADNSLWREMEPDSPRNLSRYFRGENGSSPVSIIVQAPKRRRFSREVDVHNRIAKVPEEGEHEPLIVQTTPPGQLTGLNHINNRITPPIATSRRGSTYSEAWTESARTSPRAQSVTRHSSRRPSSPPTYEPARTDWQLPSLPSLNLSQPQQQLPSHEVAPIPNHNFNEYSLDPPQGPYIHGPGYNTFPEHAQYPVYGYQQPRASSYPTPPVYPDREIPLATRPSPAVYPGPGYHYGSEGGDAMADSKPRKRRGNLPKETTDKLRAWFLAHVTHPYPTEDEKQQLMDDTGLQINQISNWFINARRRQLPQLVQNAKAETEAAAVARMISTTGQSPGGNSDGSGDYTDLDSNTTDRARPATGEKRKSI